MAQPSLPGYFVVISKTMKKTKNGDEYCQVELAHKGGTIEGKVWQDCLEFAFLTKGSVVFIEGKLETYLSKQYIVINKATPDNDKMMDDFLPEAQTPTLIFDIETIGKDFELLDSIEQDYLLNNLEKNEPDKEKAKGKTALHPLFGSVCSIALMNPVTEKGKVIGIDGEGCVPVDSRFTYVACQDEKQLLTEFWNTAEKFQRFVTFNGNDFDFPYLLIRSAIERVRVPIEVQVNSSDFIDLCKKIRAPGNRNYRLEMVTKALGITNPKAQGVHGGHVSELFAKGEFQQIIDYVARDVIATVELYRVWKTYLAGKIII
jgi:predicted PolB exonuclease-like 3'-5' exonuclease